MTLPEPANSPHDRLNDAFDPVTTEADIRACFRLLLGRNPNPEERAGHFAQAGAELGVVVKGYVNSHEFASRGFLNERHEASVEKVSGPGFDIFVQSDDLAVGHGVKAGSYEPHVTAVFKRFLKPGMSVLDIGANIGFFTMLSAHLVGPEGHVLAVEPNPANARMIEASRRLNGFRHVTVLQVAAGRQPGILALNVTHSNGTTAAVSEDLGGILGATTVPVINLDAVAPAAVDFIKIDVEGAEGAAIEGLEQTLTRCRPVIASEFSPDMMSGISLCTGPDYLRFLNKHCYGISVINHDGTVTDHGRNVEAVMEAYRRSGVDHIDILAQPQG